jgi:glutamate--cysteine ligase
VPVNGLNLIINKRSINDYAKDLIEIAKRGLKKRGLLDGSGNDESGYINQLEEITHTGNNQAKQMLSMWNDNLNESLKNIYNYYSY